jgi:hypothetical protein
MANAAASRTHPCPEKASFLEQAFLEATITSYVQAEGGERWWSVGLAATALACPLVVLDDPADSGAMAYRVVVQVLLLAVLGCSSVSALVPPF